MANPFKHSISAIKIVKADLSRIKNIINWIVNIVFVGYCVYWIVANLDSIPYIVIYSLILSLTVASFFIEPKLKPKEDDERKTKRLKKRQRILVLSILRSLKYVFKASAIGVAIYEICTTNSSDMAIIATIASGLVLLLQVIYDFAALLANKYFDMLQIAIEEDIRTSRTLRFVLRMTDKNLLKELKEDKKTYTESELKILEELENEGKPKESQMDKELKQSYDSCKAQAVKMIDNKKEKKRLFKKVKALELPMEVDTFQEVPNLVSFVKQSGKRKGDSISKENAENALASLIYIVDENDKSKESKNYSNQQLVLRNTIEQIDDEYTDFVKCK